MELTSREVAIFAGLGALDVIDVVEKLGKVFCGVDVEAMLEGVRR